MPTELFIVDPPPKMVDAYTHPAGAMWRNAELDRDGREAWVVVLPNKAGIWWTTYLADGTDPPRMWEVEGEPPRITVKPSINAGDGAGPGNWHGYITDGVMAP